MHFQEMRNFSGKSACCVHVARSPDICLSKTPSFLRFCHVLEHNYRWCFDLPKRLQPFWLPCSEKAHGQSETQRIIPACAPLFFFQTHFAAHPNVCFYIEVSQFLTLFYFKNKGYSSLSSFKFMTGSHPLCMRKRRAHIWTTLAPDIVYFLEPSRRPRSNNFIAPKKSKHKNVNSPTKDGQLFCKIPKGQHEIFTQPLMIN